MGREISIAGESSLIDPESREDAEKFVENKRAIAARLTILHELTEQLEQEHDIRKLRGRKDAHWDFR